MKEISLQMIDRHISSNLWKNLVKHFVFVGDMIEIRCWKEETSEIQLACNYGTPTEDNYEVSVKGIVTEELISELLSEHPSDRSIYNKMTKYFTINVQHEQRLFCSAHYGTEIYLTGVSDEDITLFLLIMKDFTEEDFSIHIDK